MAKYEKYAEYKDSAIKEIGVIPKHWDISKVKFLAKCLDGQRIPLNGTERGERSGTVPYWGANKIVDYVNDWIFDEELVLLGEDGAPFFDTTKDVAFAINGKIWPNNHVHVLRPNRLKVSIKYLTYSLNCTDYSLYISGSTRDKLNQSDMDNILIRMPSLIEQSQIANFLDYETAKIDTLIAKQEKLIELLKEKRQAVISHAVTKGLNPNVVMKDSGVEWLGQVPEHWEVSRFKFVCSSIIAGPFGSSITKDMYVPKGYKVYGQEQVIPNDFEIGDYYISEKNYIELNRYAVYPKDILISCVGTFGKIAVFPENAEKGIINPRLIKATVSNKFNPYFFREYLKSDAVFKQFEQLSRGGTMGVINIGILNEIIAVIPPIKEQDDIYNFIQKQKHKFNNLINKAESAIQLMQERRTALISAAVTGKIDVRNWQYPNEAKTELSL